VVYCRPGLQLLANQPVDNYCRVFFPIFPIENVSNLISTRTGIRAVPNIGNQGFTGGTNLAILRYTGAPLRDPTSDPTVNIPQSQLPLQETDLHVRIP
jgi:hypothetical protein